MDNIEEGQKLGKKDHEKDLDILRQRIIELENNQQQQFLQLTFEAKDKGCQLLLICIWFEIIIFSTNN